MKQLLFIIPKAQESSLNSLNLLTFGQIDQCSVDLGTHTAGMCFVSDAEISEYIASAPSQWVVYENGSIIQTNITGLGNIGPNEVFTFLGLTKVEL